jgi:hypothetical protein
MLGADAAAAPIQVAVPDLAVRLWDACGHGDRHGPREHHADQQQLRQIGERYRVGRASVEVVLYASLPTNGGQQIR